jgi:hypothetical protein
MRVLFWGGSNTLLGAGYTKAIGDILSNVQKITSLEITNMAVGGNSSIHGVEVARTTKDLEKFDVLFIEYTINDYSLAIKPHWQTWRRAYEGMIRYAFLANPNIKIFLLAFGRRYEDPDRRQVRMRQYLTKLENHYSQCRFDIKLIDIDTYLRGLAGEDKSSFTKLYQDKVHYSCPFPSSLIGSYIANHLTPALGLNREAELPAALCEGSFENAGIAEFQEIAPLQESCRFQNSRFHLETVALNASSEISFTLPGSLISLSYSSAGTGATLLVEEEGEAPVSFHTRHKWVDGVRFQFLIKSFSFHWKQWNPALAATPRKVSIRILNGTTPPDVQHVDCHNMLPPVEGKEPQAFLARAMYYRAAD